LKIADRVGHEEKVVSKEERLRIKQEEMKRIAAEKRAKEIALGFYYGYYDKRAEESTTSFDYVYTASSTNMAEDTLKKAYKDQHFQDLLVNPLPNQSMEGESSKKKIVKKVRKTVKLSKKVIEEIKTSGKPKFFPSTQISISNLGFGDQLIYSKKIYRKYKSKVGSNPKLGSLSKFLVGVLLSYFSYKEIMTVLRYIDSNLLIFSQDFIHYVPGLTKNAILRASLYEIYTGKSKMPPLCHPYYTQCESLKIIYRVSKLKFEKKGKHRF
jgi:hypothetical protein